MWLLDQVRYVKNASPELLLTPMETSRAEKGWISERLDQSTSYKFNPFKNKKQTLIIITLFTKFSSYCVLYWISQIVTITNCQNYIQQKSNWPCLINSEITKKYFQHNKGSNTRHQRT